MQRTTRAPVRVAPCIAPPCGDVLRLWKPPLRAAAEIVESLCFENVVRWQQLAPRLFRRRQLSSLSKPVTHLPCPSRSYSLTSRLIRRGRCLKSRKFHLDRVSTGSDSDLVKR